MEFGKDIIRNRWAWRRSVGAGIVMFLIPVAGAIVYFKLFDPTREVEVGR
jgi:hypothetical protein